MGYRRELKKRLHEEIERIRESAKRASEGARIKSVVSAALGAQAANQFLANYNEQIDADLEDLMHIASAMLNQVQPRSKRELQAWRAWVADELGHRLRPSERPRTLTSAPPLGNPQAFEAWWRVNRDAVKRLLG